MVELFLDVAGGALARAGGGPAEAAVIAWLRGLVPLTGRELDGYRWAPTTPPPVRGSVPTDATRVPMQGALRSPSART
jgi:hypothetical protein